MNKLKSIRYKKYFLYTIQKELLNQKLEVGKVKENNYVKKLVLKLF